MRREEYRCNKIVHVLVIVETGWWVDGGSLKPFSLRFYIFEIIHIENVVDTMSHL